MEERTAIDRIHAEYEESIAWSINEARRDLVGIFRRTTRPALYERLQRFVRNLKALAFNKGVPLVRSITLTLRPDRWVEGRRLANYAVVGGHKRRRLRIS